MVTRGTHILICVTAYGTNISTFMMVHGTNISICVDTRGTNISICVTARGTNIYWPHLAQIFFICVIARYAPQLLHSVFFCVFS